MAETFTDKFKLSKRDTGDLNWGQGANANLEAIDAHIQQALLRPPRTTIATLGSGAVGANLSGNTSYFYKVTAVNAAGETTEGKIPAVVEAQVTQPATPLPVIIQWETVKGATGYKIYKSTAAGQEKFLASVSGESTATYTDSGNNATNPAISPSVSNSAKTSVSKIIAGTNMTISPSDGTGDVTVNATNQTPTDASDTVKGITKLSVAPVLAANPIAVGDNDSRNTNARTPTGTASGDLSGSYPGPTVSKVNGTSVPASPSAGQVLTATSATAAAWQAPAGGGGYATVVVAAPSGVASTDTSNIQTALNTVNSAGGGTVVLREGTYLLANQITIGKNTTLIGQGMCATTLQASSSFTFPTNLINLTNNESLGVLNSAALRHFTLDGNSGALADKASPMITAARYRLLMDSIRIINPAVDSSNYIVNILQASFESFGEPVAEIRNCMWSGGKNSKALLNAGHSRITGCVFTRTSTTSTQYLIDIVNAMGNPNTFTIFSGNVISTTWNGMSNFTDIIKVYGEAIVSNNRFVVNSGTPTNSINFSQASQRGVCVGNIGVASSGPVGAIVSSSLNVAIAGNAGFSAYTGGTQSGNVV